MTATANSVGLGMLIVWTNVAAGQEAEFDAWYTREHVSDRVAVPGFRNGARLMAVRGEPKYLAVYDTDSAAVLSSAVYRERLNRPTPWTQRVMPDFRDTIRCTCKTIANAGAGQGGFQRTYRIDPADGRRDAVRAALAGGSLGGSSGGLAQQALEQPGVIRVRMAELAAPAATASTAETAMRGADRTTAFTVIVDGQDEAALAAGGRIVDTALEQVRGALAGAPAVGDYRLMYYLGKQA
jgi:hypothetical protein